VSGSNFNGLLVPDMYGALRAYREWRVDAPGEPLLSLWQSVVWATSELRADCNATTDIIRAFRGSRTADSWRPHAEQRPAPVLDCTCGIYAYWCPQVDRAVNAQVVTGVVEVSGTCIVGTKGVKAATATIRALAPTRTGEGMKREPVEWPALRPALARYYPNAVLYDSPEEMWEAWPPQPPLALIEEAQHAAA